MLKRIFSSWVVSSKNKNGDSVCYLCTEINGKVCKHLLTDLDTKENSEDRLIMNQIMKETYHESIVMEKLSEQSAAKVILF